MTQVYYVDIADPFADRLVALGLQRLIVDLLAKQDSPPEGVTFVDCGGYIQLELDEPIYAETVAALSADNYVMGVPFIRTLKNADSLPPDLTDLVVEDYEQRKEENARFYDAVKQKVDDLPPKPMTWDVLRTVNPGALKGWNGILTDWWNLRDHQPTVVGMLLEIYSDLPNPIDDATDHWKKLNKKHKWGVGESVTCQQIFNPDSGKGQNRAKAGAISVGNIKAFWMVEFLKMIGFYHDAITKTVAGGKDRKIFVIAPRNMPFKDHDEILQRFKPTINAEASTRFDILASLGYTQTLLEHYVQRDDPLAELMGLNIQQSLVGGFNTAFYMDMGNATATLNISTVALPGWVVIESEEDIATSQAILDELIKFTRQFDESHSDAFSLLQHLRDFVSGDDLEAFFQFTNAFPAYYMGMRERGKYAMQLTTSTIERIIRMTDKKLTFILETPGFQNIAYAIRQSTVTAQYRKAKGDRLYDIRYGLGQDLTRVARKGKEMQFIAALSDFIHLYNAENARVMEVRNVQYRRNVTTEDINDIVRLIDEYDAPTIARMLVAYGYARVLREDEAADDASSDATK